MRAARSFAVHSAWFGSARETGARRRRRGPSYFRYTKARGPTPGLSYLNLARRTQPARSAQANERAERHASPAKQEPNELRLQDGERSAWCRRRSSSARWTSLSDVAIASS